MVITFNELRRIKDKLPSGSSQRIADELNLDVNVAIISAAGISMREGARQGFISKAARTAGSLHWTIRPYWNARCAS